MGINKLQNKNQKYFIKVWKRVVVGLCTNGIVRRNFVDVILLKIKEKGIIVILVDVDKVVYKIYFLFLMKIFYKEQEEIKFDLVILFKIFSK